MCRKLTMKLRGFEIVKPSQLYNDFEKAHRHLSEFTGVNSRDQAKAIARTIILPSRGTQYSAGYDIYSPLSFALVPGEDIKLPTGLKVYMQSDEFLMIAPRSGSGFKHYARLANTTGIIDADYYNNSNNDGHIWVKMRNEGKEVWEVAAGDAICQAIFQKYLLADGDTANSRRTGGLGSTG